MKIRFKNSNNEKIVGIMNIADKKSSSITLIIHGFSSNKDGGSKMTAKILTKNKINNVAIDLDNLGESEPEFEDMTITKYVDIIISAIHYCEAKGFKRINIIGTSTGGLSAMACAIKYPKLNSLILRSASPSDAEWFKAFVGGKKGVDEWKKRRCIEFTGKKGIKRIKYSYYKDALQYDMYKKANKIKVPTLMIHGDKDTVLPVKNAERLSKNFPMAKLVVIKGADHSLGVDGNYLESQKEIIKWLKKK